jgi:phosphatidylinositol phospholipase C delta
MGSYKYKYCMCFTRKFRSPDAQPPPDVRAAYHSFNSDVHALRRFLSQAQGEHPADVDRIHALLTAASGGHGIARLVTRSPALAMPTLDDFFAFLFSPELNPPMADQVGCLLLGACWLLPLPHLHLIPRLSNHCLLNTVPPFLSIIIDAD